METQRFDVAVIGAGSGGLTSAVGLAKIGKKVLLIEREHIGGECTNSGCIPSKALLHHAKTYAQAVAVAGNNGHTENFRREALSYVRSKIAETLAEETPEHFTTLGITIVTGEAVFTSKNTLTVAGTAYTFKKAIIATGSQPRLVTIPGLDPSAILTNQNIFTLTAIPTKTLVIGAGPIGLELGQALTFLGSKVTIVDSGTHIGKLEDPAVATVLQRSFADSGIDFIAQGTVSRVDNNQATIETKNHGTTTVTFDNVLMAIGRIPNLPQGLDSANIQSTEFGITVNSNYQTSNPDIYALGDVADRLKFTHQADDVARSVVTRIATKGIMSVRTKAVPKVTYTKPELAQVGLSEAEAVEQFGQHKIHRIEVPFNKNDRARTDNAADGVLVVIVLRLSGKVLGAHIAGAQAGELIAIFTIAIDNSISLWKLRQTIYAYPTYALLIKRAGDYFFAQQISTLRTDLVALATRTLPKLLLAVVWILGLLALYRYQSANDMSVTDTALMVFDFISLTVWGPLLYILAYTIRPITFIPGTAMTILSGVFFGLWGGIFYTIIGANLSATLAYMIGRFFGGTATTSQNSLFGSFASACRKNPFATILTMRLLFLPYDGVNYGAGLLRVPFIPYLSATIIGTLLGIATFVAIGASLSIEEFKENDISVNAIDSTFIILSVVIFVASLCISRLIKK